MNSFRVSELGGRLAETPLGSQQTHARACAEKLWVVSTMNVPEGYATLPRVELQAPRPVGRPRGPAGSQDRSRHFMLRLNVGWTEEQ